MQINIPHFRKLLKRRKLFKNLSKREQIAKLDLGKKIIMSFDPSDSIQTQIDFARHIIKIEVEGILR